jgi:hypothetical protein
MEICGIDYSYTGQGKASGFCDRSNESLDPVKCMGFLESSKKLFAYVCKDVDIFLSRARLMTMDIQNANAIANVFESR